MIEIPAQWPNKLPCRIALVGEAGGEHEEALRAPFVGPSGKLLNKALRAAGIERADCLVTNVFPFKLDNNSVKSLTHSRTAMVKECGDDEWSPWIKQSLESGAYMPRALAEEHLGRLRSELLRSNANIVVALGGTALWALLALQGHGTVSKLRGTQHPGRLTGQKVLPTFHPAYIVRAYQNYPIFWSDLRKVEQASHAPELVQEQFGEFTEVTRADQVEGLLDRLVPPVACDIETVRRTTIDCIGFSDGALTFSVPFFDNKTMRPVWSAADEVLVRRAVCRWLESSVPKIWQNGAYDLVVLWEVWRVQARGYAHDTRLLHHALWPELEKSLGKMVSLHLGLPAWKPIRGEAGKVEE